MGGEAKIEGRVVVTVVARRGELVRAVARRHALHAGAADIAEVILLVMGRVEVVDSEWLES